MHKQSNIQSFFSKRLASDSNDSSDKSRNALPSKRHEKSDSGDSGAREEGGMEEDDLTWEDDMHVQESEDDSEEEEAAEPPRSKNLPSFEITESERTTLNPPGPSDLSQGKADTPKQPKMPSFPAHQIGNRLRSFKTSWYTRHSWLEYSLVKDAAYCFCCRHFPQSGKTPEATFVSSGFRQWKKATEKDSGFTQHEKSDFHKNAMCAWKEFEEHMQSGKTIDKMLSSAREKHVSENQQYIKEVAKVLCLTARQNIAQRGHCEVGSSLNKGNFLEIMELLSEKDSVIKSHLSSKSAKYTSPSIQNELLEIMSQIILSEICVEIRQSVWYSIMVDESKDMSGNEQLSVVVRYLYDNSIHEEFLGFIRLHELNAEYLKNSICTLLLACGIEATNCVGQTYDGASVMSGSNAGVQTLFRQDAAPQATYIHCYNHRLNLVIVDCVKSVKLAADFFGLLQSFYVFMSSSVVHEIFLQKQSELFPDRQVRKLKRLSETRWACQHTACKIMQETLPAVIETLDELSVEHSGKRATDAKGLLKTIDFAFVLNLVMFTKILHKSKLLSDMLQSPALDLAAAADLIETVQEELREERNDVSWNVIWSKAEEMAKELDIPVKPIHTSRKKKQSSMLKDFVTTDTVGQGDSVKSIEIEHDFCVKLYYPVIDHLLSELDSRFSEANKQLLRSISALDPRSSRFMSKEHIEPMASHYGVELSDLAVELHQAKRLIQRKSTERDRVQISTLVQLSSFLSPYKDAFPDLYKLITIALVLPPTSASCERSFSSMRMIKNYLRTSMADTRLSSLAVLGIHVARAKSLNFDKVVSNFAKKHNNRKIALF